MWTVLQLNSVSSYRLVITEPDISTVERNRSLLVQDDGGHRLPALFPKIPLKCRKRWNN